MRTTRLRAWHCNYCIRVHPNMACSHMQDRTRTCNPTLLCPMPSMHDKQTVGSLLLNAGVFLVPMRLCVLFKRRHWWNANRNDYINSLNDQFTLISADMSGISLCMGFNVTLARPRGPEIPRRLSQSDPFKPKYANICYIYNKNWRRNARKIISFSKCLW